MAILGGDDLLHGGRGGDLLLGDGIATGLGTFLAEVRGGDDTLVGGIGNDVLWGDGIATAPTGPTRVLGGADTFVFRPRDGFDKVMDFRASDGDQIRIVGALDWEDLDTDGSGVLGGADDFVTRSGADTSLDLGAASGRSQPALNVVTLYDAGPLTEADFVFA